MHRPFTSDSDIKDSGENSGFKKKKNTNVPLSGEVNPYHKGIRKTNWVKFY